MCALNTHYQYSEKIQDFFCPSVHECKLKNYMIWIQIFIHLQYTYFVKIYCIIFNKTKYIK